MTRIDPITRLWHAAGYRVPAFLLADLVVSVTVVFGAAAGMEILLRFIAGD